MEIAEALQYVKQENPALVEALQVLTSTVTPEQRAALNTLLTETLKIKGDCVDKRGAALGLLGWRTSAHEGYSGQSQFLRQPPDVMIRTLCRIAEVTHHYGGDPSFLDRMEERNRG